MVEAVLAAFLSSDRVLVLPLMVTYLGSNPRSTSTPSSRVGRSRRWPMVAFTSYPEPRYFPMVLALVGDSTITSASPLPPAVAVGRAVLADPFPLRPLAGALGAAAMALPPLAGLVAGLDFSGVFTLRLGLVAMNSVCLVGSSWGQPSVAARNPRGGGGARRLSLTACGRMTYWHECPGVGGRCRSLRSLLTTPRGHAPDERSPGRHPPLFAHPSRPHNQRADSTVPAPPEGP